MKRRDFLKGLGFSAAAIAVIPAAVVAQAEELEKSLPTGKAYSGGWTKDYMPERVVEQTARFNFSHPPICLYDDTQQPPQLAAIGHTYGLSMERPLIGYISLDELIEPLAYVAKEPDANLECREVAWNVPPKHGHTYRFVIENEDVVITGLVIMVGLEIPSFDCTFQLYKDMQIIHK